MMRVRLQLRLNTQKWILILEGYAPTSHAEYLALTDQDETLLNARVNQLDDIIDELAKSMDI